ncbi:type VI secretion system baseplate subunit TssE [Vibrio sp. LaRot3]|uniref:type VI secretion system baseplate subunit TssE n=1 Tax=Vibrio sp. LaRot3 TaxID=2998829 RepID=UPI0022CDDEB6|nr:type VI secretion system baseplate subunit TssE [Vibrio sp. LaRot3]MDA0149660.1 type VI secretion system baseplate subunit TssE [Vibrio sp. LaRot3]
MSFWTTFINPQPASYKDDIEDIRYHLTRLLDSEASLISIDSRLTQVQQSNYRFGIEDVHLLSANLDKHQLAMKLESYIKTFEPRLNQVMVEIIDRKAGENTIAFNVVAKTNTSHGEKELIFDSKISLNDLTTDMQEDMYE